MLLYCVEQNFYFFCFALIFGQSQMHFFRFILLVSFKMIVNICQDLFLARILNKIHSVHTVFLVLCIYIFFLHVFRGQKNRQRRKM